MSNKLFLGILIACFLLLYLAFLIYLFMKRTNMRFNKIGLVSDLPVIVDDTEYISTPDININNPNFEEQIAKILQINNTLVKLWRQNVSNRVPNLVDLEPTLNDSSTFVPSLFVSLNFHNFDCANKPYPCVNTNQCYTICNNTKFYECEQGKCQVQNINNKTPKLCNTKHGIFAVLVGVNNLGTALWKCVSLYSLIWDDDDNQNPQVCTPGIIDADLTVQTWSHKMCTCFDGYTKIVNKKFNLNMQEIPRCVKDVKFFLKDYMIPMER